MDRQCSSCGGFCKQSGCERENVATNDTSQERVDETEKDQHEPVAWINFCGFTGEMTVDFDCESELVSIPLYKKEQL